MKKFIIRIIIVGIIIWVINHLLKDRMDGLFADLFSILFGFIAHILLKINDRE